MFTVTLFLFPFTLSGVIPMKKQAYQVFSVYVEGRLVGKIDATTGDEAEDNARSKFRVHPSSRVRCVLPVEPLPVSGIRIVQDEE